MRMRIKKWARPELAVCPFYVPEPSGNKGRWREAFRRSAPLHVELGCGKGVSTSRMAFENPDVNYVAIDLITSVLGVCKRHTEAAYAGYREVDNILLTNYEIERINDLFDENDGVERIYISFPNPWDDRHKQYKHRLTHTRQLMNYRRFMADNGEIWFKTDDDQLFRDSLVYFEESGFEITFKTYDLHASGFAPNYESEHERMFTEQGIPTKALIAVKRPLLETEVPETEVSETEVPEAEE